MLLAALQSDFCEKDTSFAKRESLAMGCFSDMTREVRGQNRTDIDVGSFELLAVAALSRSRR